MEVLHFCEPISEVDAGSLNDLAGIQQIFIQFSESAGSACGRSFGGRVCGCPLNLFHESQQSGPGWTTIGRQIVPGFSDFPYFKKNLPLSEARF